MTTATIAYCLTYAHEERYLMTLGYYVKYTGRANDLMSACLMWPEP